MEQEPACDDILPAGGGELLLGGEVQVAGKDAFEQWLLPEVGDEIAGDAFSLLEAVGLAADFGQFRVIDGALVPPEAGIGAPDVLGHEGDMHAEDDREPFFRFFPETGGLVLGDVAIDIVQGDEIHSVRDLGLEADVEGIDLLEEVAGVVLVGLRVLFPGLAVAHVGAEFMVADRPDVLGAEILPHQVEIRLTLPVDEVARVDQVIHVLLRPGDRVLQRLFLVTAEGGRAFLVERQLFLVLVGVGGRQVRVGDVQDGERFLQPDVHGGITEGKAFPLAAAGENFRPVFREGGKLKEVRIKPEQETYRAEVVLEIADAEKKGKLSGMEPEKIAELFREAKDPEYRIVSIDPGVNNFCAVTNNFGEKPFLIKGGVLKSANQYYNKKLAEFRSEAERCNGRKQTRRIRKLTDKRNRILKDLMHKASRKITDWAVEHEADVVILGHNRFQKQRIRTGHVNNQNIVQIPQDVFAGMLRYKLEEEGILLVEQEESYTSKADFLAGDAIPVYGEEKEEFRFSGVRPKRGLYRHGDGTLSNADINGAGNILRKVFPNVTGWDRGIVDMPYVVRIA